MESIESINDIISLAQSGFTDWQEHGFVTVRKSDDLFIFNYNTQAIFEARWNFFERVSRGLIINSKTGEIVARAFDKFFNWNEFGTIADKELVTVIEKMDGSLGILYRHDGGYKIATRGSFDGEQALWATEFLNANYELDNLDTNLTLLFEIIYPENRVVVDYAERQDLVLLAVRNRFTGDYLAFEEVDNIATEFGFSLPKVYQFDGIKELLNNVRSLDATNEGFVAEFDDGTRYKFKSIEYLKLHKLIVTLSFKNVLSAMQSGNIEQILDTVPDEFLGEVRIWIVEIEQTIQSIKDEVQTIFEQAPQDSRKEFALWVNKTQSQEMRSYLFALLVGKDILPLIYQNHDWGRDEDA